MQAWKYDVFISFRGRDTRKGFTSFLIRFLELAGMRCYLDDTDARGQAVGRMLRDAINHSRIAVILFSKNYVGSTWCLNELVDILRCKRRTNASYVVIPIFYDVKPSEVRSLSGEFGIGFRKSVANSKDKEEEKIWRDAVVEAAHLSGWDLDDHANGNQLVLIDKIVRDISRRIFCEIYCAKRVHIDNHRHAHTAKSLLGTYPSGDTHSIGATESRETDNKIMAELAVDVEVKESRANTSDVVEHHGLVLLQKNLLFHDAAKERQLELSYQSPGIIQSRSIHTNRRTYGGAKGTSFCILQCTQDHRKTVGFFGKCSRFLDSIDACLGQPFPRPYPFITKGTGRDEMLSRDIIMKMGMVARSRNGLAWARGLVLGSGTAAKFVAARPARYVG